MKRIILSIILLMSLTMSTFAEKDVWVPDPKDAKGYVYDEMGILSETSIEYINETNYDLEKKTGAQIGVMIVKSLQGYDGNSYGVKIFDKWKFGNKENNGLLILLSIPEGSLTIMPGYRTEGWVPDAVADTIRRNASKLFPPGDRTGENKEAYEEGILEIYNEVLETYKQEYDIEIERSVPASFSPDDEDSDISPIRIIMFVIIILIILSTNNRRRKYRRRYRRNIFYDDDDFGGGFGGFFGGGGFGGGSSGSSGGGFGGFAGGGGSTGGGGSSGSW